MSSSSEKKNPRNNGQRRHESEPQLPGVDDPSPHHKKHHSHHTGSGIMRSLKKAFSFGDTDLEASEAFEVNDGGENNGNKKEGDTPSSSHARSKTPPKAEKRNHSPLQRALSYGKGKGAGLHGGAGVRWYHNLFPLRQKFEPRVEYPLWDENWDGNQNYRRRLMAEWAAGSPPKYVVVRHIFMIRHGQYHEHHTSDEKKTLTPLGRQQAKKTGERIAKIIQHNNTAAKEHSRVTVFASSDLTRAKETADIIHQELEDTYNQHNADCPDKFWEPICRSEPDPDLNEGFPVHHIPGPKGFKDLHSNDIDRDFPRIERAFLNYIGRSRWLQERDDPNAKGLLDGELIPEEVATRTATHRPQHNLKTIHEYEIIVGHANVIRYFICRALQIPPECWLRLNPYHCSISYLAVSANGLVTARMVGDNGHLPYEEASVDGTVVGFNWE